MDNKTIIHWEFIIPLFIIIILISIFKFIDFLLKSKKIFMLISKDDYNKVLILSKKIKSLHKKNISLYEQRICLSLAVFFYENNDLNNFEYYINKIRNNKIIVFRYFWKAIQAYCINDIVDFNKNYDLFINNVCLDKKWQKGYKEYYEILKIIHEYVDSNNLNIEKFKYYKNRLTLKSFRNIFIDIESKYNLK